MDAFDIAMDFLHSSWVLDGLLPHCVRKLQLRELVDDELAILVDKLMVGPVVSFVVCNGNEQETNPCV